MKRHADFILIIIGLFSIITATTIALEEPIDKEKSEFQALKQYSYGGHNYITYRLGGITHSASCSNYKCRK